jgi:hypothetical protein
MLVYGAVAKQKDKAHANQLQSFKLNDSWHTIQRPAEISEVTLYSSFR